MSTVDELGGEFADRVAELVAEQMKPCLNPMTPQEAVDKYFKIRNLKPKTEGTHKSSLNNHFVPWCEEIAGIDDMNSLTGQHLADYRVWRRDEASNRVEKLSPKTEESQQKITRTFIEHCESWEIVRPGLHEYVLVPTIDDDADVRDAILDSKSAKEILTWLYKYQYANRQHVVWLLLASCGPRTGGIHSLDLDDYVTDKEGPYLNFEHRPETGTTLKNGKKGERNVEIPQSVSEVLDDYIADAREDQTDEYGRQPLLTTKYGRLSTSAIRNYVYAWTRPCVIGQECPYGRDPDECDGARRIQWAFKCPDSLSCHPIRKGYITDELASGVPKAVLVGRCDVSEDVMDKHYDFRDKKQKMKARRIARKLALDKESGYGE